MISYHRTEWLLFGAATRVQYTLLLHYAAIFFVEKYLCKKHHQYARCGAAHKHIFRICLALCLCVCVYGVVLLLRRALSELNLSNKLSIKVERARPPSAQHITAPHAVGTHTYTHSQMCRVHNSHDDGVHCAQHETIFQIIIDN